MSTFLLADLESHLLEKIITKVGKKSYFRLQQTCHTIYDFIRKSQNISICIDEDYSLFSRNNKLDMAIINDTEKEDEEVDFEEFVGTRIRQLSIEEGSDFQPIYNGLKKNHVTCEELQIWPSTWTKDEIATLIKLLKPVEINIESRNRSDRYEALLHGKYLKTLYVYVDPNDALAAIKKLFNGFPYVHIDIRMGPKPAILLRDIFYLLQSLSPSLDQNMTFHIGGSGRHMDWSADFMNKEFGQFMKNKFTESKRVSKIQASIKMPEHYPPGSSGKIFLQDGFILDVTYSLPH